MKIDNTKNIIHLENINKIAEKSSNNKNQNMKDIISYSDKKDTNDLNEAINLNIISYYCRRANSKKNRLIKLYDKKIHFIEKKWI